MKTVPDDFPDEGCSKVQTQNVTMSGQMWVNLHQSP